MKRSVSITFDIDTSEYVDVEDTPQAIIDLIESALNGEADFPKTLTITCESFSKKVEMW